MNLRHVLFFVLLVFFSATVFAGNWHIGYQEDGLGIEYWEGGNWVISYGYLPYEVYYGDYYFINRDFRFYYGGNYSYYPSGWYSNYYFNNYSPGAWTFDAFDGSGYYYSPNYYYYHGYWQYDPYWPTTYGAVYYNYYPSGYYQSGAYNTGDGIGNGYRYEQNSNCGELSVSTGYVSLGDGEEKEFDFTARNSGEKNFEINSAELYIDSFNLTKEKLSFDEEINAGASGSITAKISAENGASSENADATLTIYGQFSDGKECTVEKDFTIRLNDPPASSSGSGAGNSNSYSNYSYIPSSTWSETGEGSTNSWNSTEFNGNEWNDFDNGSSQKSSNPSNSNSFTPSTDLISFSLYSGMTVFSGKTTSKTFYIYNQSNSALIIEGAVIEAYGNSFNASAKVKDKYIPSKAYGGITIELSADEIEEQSTETAMLTVFGYFKSNNESFSIEKELNVKVIPAGNETEENENKRNSKAFFAETELFELNVPKELNVEEGMEKSFAVYVSNPYDNDAIIYLSAENASLSKTKIPVPANKKLTAIISVSGVSDNTRINYSARIPGVHVQGKFTEIIYAEGSGNEDKSNANIYTNNSGNSEEESSNAQESSASQQQNADNNPNESNSSNIATAFAVLSTNAFNLGLIILILVLGFAIYRKMKG